MAGIVDVTSVPLLGSIRTPPADLSSLPRTGFSGLQDGNEIRFARRGRTHKVEVTSRLGIDQIVGHSEALLAGAGVGTIHRYAQRTRRLANAFSG